jgi:arylsulfatase A-like enzyme
MSQPPAPSSRALRLILRRLPAGALVIAALLPFVSPRAVRAAEARRNVLLIISDDLNTLLGCYGDPLARTPNLDRLASRGVRFDRAYCTFPLCGPTRNSFLTGLYPNSTGIFANAQLFRQTIPAQVSLPQAFRLAGYYAVRIGKMYHYNVPASIGTDGHDDPASWELESNPAGVDRMDEEPQIFTLTPGQFGGTLSWYASPHDDPQHTDGLMAADAEWVLERQAQIGRRPFFVGLGFFRPHTPYVAPKRYFDLYPLDKMPVVQGVAEDQADIPKPALGSHRTEEDKLTDDLRRQARQAYYASISFMDAQVGHVIAALDRLGLSDHTIVVFTSDHGYHLGEHGLWQKQSLFEESVRVPLLIIAPGVSRAGAVVSTPVSLLDLYPTLTELAGVTPPRNLQGQSLVPLLRDPSAKGRGWALTQVTRGGATTASPSISVGSLGRRFFGYSLRTVRWRYTEWDGGREGRELYDHDADPKELRNLADVPGHAGEVAQLTQQLHDAIKTTFPPSGESPALKPGTGMWSPLLPAQ